MVIDGTLAKIGPAAFCVLLVVKMASGPQGKARIGLRTIADRCGIAKRTVIRSLEVLEENDLLSVQRFTSSRKCNVYQVSDKLTAYDPSIGRDAEGKVGEVLIPHKPGLGPALNAQLAELQATGKVPQGSPIQFIQIENLAIHLGKGDIQIQNVKGIEDALQAAGVTVPVTEVGKRIADAILDIPKVKKAMKSKP